MATEAARIPGRMASDATHILVLVSTDTAILPISIRAVWEFTPDKLPALGKSDCLTHGRFRVIARVIWVDYVHNLWDFPLLVFFNHGVLQNLAPLTLEAPLAKRRAERFQISTSWQCIGRRSAAPKRRPLRDGAVAVDAL